MKTHDAIEQAYKNGYAKGKADALKWIPITERLPEEKKMVFVNRKGAISVEFQRGCGWSYDHFTKIPVTHWMPLPEPPKGE